MTRGDVFRVRLPEGRGHEQRGPRYGVVVQADELLALSTVLVAPTSTRAAPASFRPEVTVDDQPMRVLVEQTRALAPARLGRFMGTLSAAELRAVDDALELVLGLR